MRQVRYCHHETPTQRVWPTPRAQGTAFDAVPPSSNQGVAFPAGSGAMAATTAAERQPQRRTAP